jgi:nucleoside-diphosphate-sugar epimerase
VARYCARQFDLPVTIARMGSAYGDRGGLPLWHLNAIAAGQPVVARWDPLPYSPIHYDDINAQLEPLLDAATVPATIVNWCGDVPVTVQEWSAYFGELLGTEAQVVTEVVPGASVGSVGDHTKRTSITGPCRVDWRDGFRDMAALYFPDRVKAG